MKFLKSYILFVCIASISVMGETRVPESIPVHFQEEGRQTEHLQGFVSNRIDYVALEDLASLMDIRYFFNEINRKMVLRLGSQSLKVTGGNPYITIDDEIYQMALPAIDDNGKVYIPLALFLAAVGDKLPAQSDFDHQTRTLNIHRFLYNITGIEVEERSNGNLIRILTQKEFKPSDVSASIRKGWLYVTIYGGTLDSVQLASIHGLGFVKKISPFQFESSVQISFLINDKILEKNIITKPDEVVISLRKSNKIDENVILNQQTDNKRWLIDRIIIDPGHGGKDPGAIGANGLYEKDVNLEIAKRLKKLLENELNVEVLMTREDDTFIPLKDRTKFANTHDGKLFISIHANANRSPTARGFSTLILGPARSQEALELAEKENSVIDFEEAKDAYDDYKNAAHILNAITQSTNLKESQDLARMLTGSMKRYVKIPQFGKGVYQANVYVLVGAAMPRILVETAFISNRYEAKQLRTNAFRQKIAQAIFESVKQFKEKYEKGVQS